MKTRLAIYALCAFAILCGLSIFAADAVNYTRLRKRVVGRELINSGAQVVYTYQQGAKTWCETNDVRRINAPRSIRYSKLKLIVAAKAAGKWGEVKSFIEANDMLDEWNACQYITSDYPAFIAATNAVVSAGIATSDQIAVFLKLAED